jgi:hypothetical protein
MRAGLLAVLALGFAPALGVAGCASTASGPSASLQEPAIDGASDQRNVRAAPAERRAPARVAAPARVSPAQSSWAPEGRAQAVAEPPPIGTTGGPAGRSMEEIRRANAAATAEADRRQDEHIRGIMTICANCGMGR